MPSRQHDARTDQQIPPPGSNSATVTSSTSSAPATSPGPVIEKRPEAVDGLSAQPEFGHGGLLAYAQRRLVLCSPAPADVPGDRRHVEPSAVTESSTRNPSHSTGIRAPVRTCAKAQLARPELADEDRGKHVVADEGALLGREELDDRCAYPQEARLAHGVSLAGGAIAGMLRTTRQRTVDGTATLKPVRAQR